jgi:hypothetical protein
MSEVVQNDVILCRPTRVVSRYVTVSSSLDRGRLTDMIVSRAFHLACEDLRDLRNLRRTRAAWVILVARLAFQTTFVVVDMPPLFFLASALWSP